jgi:hypothetical protein
MISGRSRFMICHTRCMVMLPADQRNAHAQFNLGVLWEQGRGGLSKDDREAARLYQLAASSRINLARRWQACGNFCFRNYQRGRKRGQCQCPGCACGTYSPLTDKPRPVNKYAGRLLYRKRT